MKNDVDWVFINPNDNKTYPTKYGKYLTLHDDDSEHIVVWNNTGFAYHHNEIIAWKKLEEK